MSEQRLIDANVFKECWKPGVIGDTLRRVIDDQPTIDPESPPIVQQLRAELERVKAQKNAAIGELNGVLASVDALTEFVDAEVYPVVDYSLYLQLREKVDAVVLWEHQDEWSENDEQ